jgi:hypothetical protein
MTEQSLPKSLRQPMVEGALLDEKARLLEAEAEEKAGIWEGLPEMIRAYRMRRRTDDWIKYRAKFSPPSAL